MRIITIHSASRLVVTRGRLLYGKTWSGKHDGCETPRGNGLDEDEGGAMLNPRFRVEP